MFELSHPSACWSFRVAHSDSFHSDSLLICQSCTIVGTSGTPLWHMVLTLSKYLSLFQGELYLWKFPKVMWIQVGGVR